MREKYDGGYSSWHLWLLESVTSPMVMEPESWGRIWGGAILTVCPELFPAYYEHLLKNEDWSNAEAAIEFFIRRADLNDPINQAIARTVVDSDDLKVLRDRAASGDAGALATFEVQERFLGGIRFQERDLTGGSMVETQEPLILLSPEDYPPEKFKDYLDVLRQQGIDFRHELVTTWFDHWTQAGRGPDVLDAVEALIGQERLSARIDHLFDRVFELCRTLRGRSMAFPWLVRAHRARNGWHSFYAPKEETRKRFEVIGREYRDRWLEFVQETAVSRYTPGRLGHAPVIGLSTLVEFCLAVGQKEVAVAVAEAIVRTTLERRADLNLPLPAWVPSA